MTDIRHFTASAVVLDDQDRVLLVHHNKLDQWLYPGGHIDPNEDPAQAALREVHEETGIQATVLGEPAFAHPSVRSHAAPWAIIEMDVTDSRIGAHQHIDLVFVARATGGRLAAQLTEVRGARWVPVSEVAGLTTPPELPALVDAAVRWAKSSPTRGRSGARESGTRHEESVNATSRVVNWSQAPRRDGPVDSGRGTTRGAGNPGR